MADERPVGRPATRRDAAVEFLLKNPTAKDKDVAASLQMDMATVGRARKKLIDEGLINPATRRRAPAREPAALPSPPAPRSDTLLTDEDLRDLEVDAQTDEDTKKKILKALRQIAFGPGINHETAMSAMALWVKLKDQAAAKELGPGKPMTRADAKERVLTLMKAIGFDLIFECFQELFVPKEPADEGKVPVDDPETPSAPAGTPPTP